jgi:asparagine synthase (glutamine-hydrolysing)
MGFARLAINETGPLGRQPYRHGALIGAINGEIYNHHALANASDLKATSCDTHIVLPLFERYGPRVIDELDGFFSGVVVESDTSQVYCLRDDMGKKPLFVGRSKSEIFVVSELKVLDSLEWVKPLPRGVSSIDLRTGQATQIAEHRALPPQTDLPVLFEAAVRKRLLHSDQPVGVFLSGGLDSSLVAAFVARERQDATYFTLGDPCSPDRRAVEALVKTLGLKDVRVVPLPHRDRLPELVERVVYATESFNPSIVSNGLATYLLAEAAHNDGLKVVLTGEGADELFGGYHAFGPDDPWREVRNQLIDDMHLTELRRLDLSCMANGVEPRCPFLDRAVRRFSDGLAFHELYAVDQNKVVLRRCFEGVLPPEVLHRRKASFDVGSGIRNLLVHYLHRNGRSERDELRELWSQHFRHHGSEPYFHTYPAFDAAIDRRGPTHR